MAKKFKMLSFVQICGVQSFRVAANGSRLGEVGDLDAQSLKLLLMLIKNTNDE